MGISNSVREMQHVGFGKSEKQSLARDVVQLYAWPTAGTLEIGGVNCGAEMAGARPTSGLTVQVYGSGGSCLDVDGGTCVRIRRDPNLIDLIKIKV
jgi:hypothetical protein